jgi:hypothetical protein
MRYLWQYVKRHIIKETAAISAQQRNKLNQYTLIA